jgi:hypothetical protein
MLSWLRTAHVSVNHYASLGFGLFFKLLITAYLIRHITARGRDCARALCRTSTESI